MTISGTSVLDADTLPHQYHASSTNPLVNEYRTKDGRLHRPGLPAVRPLLARVLRARRALRVAGRRALHRLVDPPGQRRRAASSCSTSCSSSGRWPSGRSCCRNRTANGTSCFRPGRCSTTSRPRRTATCSASSTSGDGKVVLVAAPVQFDGEAPTLGKAPAFGADTDQVLAECGLDAKTIASLREQQIVS